MKTHTVLAIGAHVGDAELTAGALLATCAVHGGKAVTLALTAGEKGAPIGADIAAYRADKIAQAEAFAKDLAPPSATFLIESSMAFRIKSSFVIIKTTKIPFAKIKIPA